MSKAEKFISDNTMNCSNELAFDNKDGSKLYRAWLSPYNAKCAVEIAREEMIERACKWLQCHYRVIDGEVEDFIWSLKQAMKNET